MENDINGKPKEVNETTSKVVNEKKEEEEEEKDKDNYIIEIIGLFICGLFHNVYVIILSFKGCPL